MIKYFFKIWQHKYYVFVAGMYMKVSLFRLIKHDFSKFLPSEFVGYYEKFYSKSKNGKKFPMSWRLHYSRNDHHWEYWLIIKGLTNSGEIEVEASEMPEPAVREMVADWLGASRSYEGEWPQIDSWKWYKENKDRIIVHPNTQNLIDTLLEEYTQKNPFKKGKTNE